MSYSIIIGILLGISLLSKFVFHFNEFASTWFIVALGLLLMWDLSWNEVLPRIFPNSFMTVEIRYVDNPITSGELGKRES